MDQKEFISEHSSGRPTEEASTGVKRDHLEVIQMEDISTTDDSNASSKKLKTDSSLETSPEEAAEDPAATATQTAMHVEFSNTYKSTDQAGSNQPGTSGAGQRRGRRRVYRMQREDSSDDDDGAVAPRRNAPRARVSSTPSGGVLVNIGALAVRGAPENNDAASDDNADSALNADLAHNSDHSSSTSSEDLTSRRRNRWSFLQRATDSLSELEESSDDEEAEDPQKVEKEVEEEVQAILDKKTPQNTFNLMHEIKMRQYTGVLCSRGRSAVGFTQRFSSSLRAVQRLSLFSALPGHSGCVNCVGFSSCGTRLVSGSDDLQLQLWDWARNRRVATFDSGHKNNVFKCEFVPYSDNRKIVTCARDGQVRLAEVAEAVVHATRRLTTHSRAVHSLSLTPWRPNLVISAGEDGAVTESDTRTRNAHHTLASVRDDAGAIVPLYSVGQHPRRQHEYLVAGCAAAVRVFDRRQPRRPALRRHVPAALRRQRQHTVTAAVYSGDGDAILASHSNDDVFLFDNRPEADGTGLPPSPEDHRYSGHRNGATIKGVSFFGARSEYVLSGSDCGHVFVWHRDTEALLHVFKGDENGVVNALTPHPHLPLLATSGLDNDVKLWAPLAGSGPPSRRLLEDNLRGRRQGDADLGDAHFLGLLMNHVRQARGQSGPPQCVSQ